MGNPHTKLAPGELERVSEPLNSLFMWLVAGASLFWRKVLVGKVLLVGG
jgi:hypothetical protein